MFAPTGKRKARVAAVLQLLALLVLQLALLTPPIAMALAATKPHKVCQGDHTLCGCPPERIAAGTCCCAMSKRPACCKTESVHPHRNKGPVIAAQPCGTSDPVTMQAIEDFLGFGKSVPPAMERRSKYPPSSPEYPIHQNVKPLIPPPQSHSACYASSRLGSGAT